MALVVVLLGIGWSATGGSSPAHADEEFLVDGPVRFEVADGGRLQVDGERRYLDTLEVGTNVSGPVLVNELGMEDYVAGIAEVPADWPMETLKAQAVAARTYAWYVMRTSTYDGYDICATVACQVFRGADVVIGSRSGDRWRDAVDETAGEVLLDDGLPVLARYFSTSGGRTYANEEVFSASGVHDHLVSIEDPYDEVSPYHRWTVRFTREEFDTLAARGQRLSATVPVEDVERIGAVDDPRATIRVTGSDGTQVEVGAGELRDLLSRVAPDSFPDRFPPLRHDGLRALPSTVPTARYDVEVSDDEVVLHGEGWGHGVGMGQYGAKGRAEEGADYLDILAAYYNGLSPSTSDELPGRVRVGMGMDDRLTIGADAAVRVSADGEQLEEGALGTWSIVRDGDRWRLTAPMGHGEPLEIPQTELAEGLRPVRDSVTLVVEVNKPVRLGLVVTDGRGEPVVERDLGVVDAGRHTAIWRLDDQDGSIVPSGSYQVGLIGQDHAGENAGTPVEVSVPLEDDDTWPPDQVGGAVTRNPLRTVAVLLGLLAVVSFLVIRRTR